MVRIRFPPAKSLLRTCGYVDPCRRDGLFAVAVDNCQSWLKLLNAPSQNHLQIAPSPKAVSTALAVMTTAAAVTAAAVTATGVGGTLMTTAALMIATAVTATGLGGTLMTAAALMTPVAVTATGLGGTLMTTTAAVMTTARAGEAELTAACVGGTQSTAAGIPATSAWKRRVVISARKTQDIRKALEP
jgi:hypothetical protein